MMDITSFRRYAVTYGGDLSRWPTELLPAAADLLKREPAIEAILNAELDMDRVLQNLPSEGASADLRARIIAIPHQHLSRPFWLKPRHLVPALALCSMLGLLVGMNDPIRSLEMDQNHSAWIFAPEQTVQLD